MLQRSLISNFCYLFCSSLCSYVTSGAWTSRSSPDFIPVCSLHKVEKMNTHEVVVFPTPSTSKRLNRLRWEIVFGWNTQHAQSVTGYSKEQVSKTHIHALQGSGNWAAKQTVFWQDTSWLDIFTQKEVWAEKRFKLWTWINNSGYYSWSYLVFKTWRFEEYSISAFRLNLHICAQSVPPISVLGHWQQ